MAQQKHTILTFKAEESLVDALKAVPNRSAFIRSAVLAALDNVCPVCQGVGMLSAAQKTHWEGFAKRHPIRECGQCHEWHLVCPAIGEEHPHRKENSK